MLRFCTAGAAGHAIGTGVSVGSATALDPVQEHRLFGMAVAKVVEVIAVAEQPVARAGAGVQLAIIHDVHIAPPVVVAVTQL
jgi:hypothetical protein